MIQGTVVVEFEGTELCFAMALDDLDLDDQNREICSGEKMLFPDHALQRFEAGDFGFDGDAFPGVAPIVLQRAEIRGVLVFL